MKTARITSGGQLSIPAAVRRRWGSTTVALEDHGDYVVIRPVPDDPVAAARGALKGRKDDAASLRRRARADEGAAERRPR